MPTPLRIARKAPLALVVLLLALSLLPTPASAAVGGDGGGNGGTGGNGGVGGVNYICATDGSRTGWHMLNGRFRFVRYMSLFSRCTSSSYRTTGMDAICQVGFEVFRFYSLGSPTNDVNNPHAPVAWTRSVVGQPSWCENPGMTYFYPHPGDRANVSGTAWAAGGGTNRHGQQWTSIPGGLLSTNAPYQKGGDCAVLNVGQPGRPADPLKRYFQGGADYSQPHAATVRQAVYNIYKEWERKVGWQLALTTINARNTGPVPHPDAILYDDGRLCSSDMDFATIDGNAPVVYGTCYIPLQKRATQFYLSGNRSNTLWDYYTEQDGRGGTRYSTMYAGDTKAAVPAWRNYIWHIVAGSAGPGAHYTGPLNRQYAAPMNNRIAAANEARDFSRCVSARAASASNPRSVVTPVPAAEVRLNLSAPEVFQTGHAMAANTAQKPNTLSVQSGALMCQSGSSLKDCATVNPVVAKRPLLTTLHFGADLRGANGYVGPLRSASTGQVSGNCSPLSLSSKHTGTCDFVIARNQQNDRIPAGDGTRAAPRVDKQVTQQGMFFSPTQRSMGSTPAQKVQIQLTGGAAPVPYAKYSMPETGFSEYRFCVGAEPRRECYRVKTEILTYSIRDVPVSFHADLTADGVTNPVQVARFENGRQVFGPAGAYWTKDVIGATGMTK